jgi:hypothetical protein
MVEPLIESEPEVGIVDSPRPPRPAVFATAALPRLHSATWPPAKRCSESDRRDALEAALAWATKAGFVQLQLELRLAPARLEALERDAKTKGFLLIARKAIRARLARARTVQLRPTPSASATRLM